jgi:DNA-binding response OmpR family regulator
LEAAVAKKVLVVDDELQTVKLIGLVLQRRGYEIVAASLGTQGLAKAQAEDPDLIVLDVMMPDMNGFEVCRRLRADPATAGIPIIMFTARTMVDDKVTGFQAGADDYLTKPVHPDELATRVEALLARFAQRQVEQHPLVRAKVLGFLGAKGGVGTTTLAVNVAAALAHQPEGGQQVVLADMRSGMAASAVQLGLQRHGGVVHLLNQPVEDIKPSMVEAQLDEHSTGVRLLTGQIEPPGVAMPVPPAHAEVIVRRLGAMADYLLLDLGVGLDHVNCHVLPGCDHVVVAIEPDRVALTLAQALLHELDLSLNLARHRISVVMIGEAPSIATVTQDVVEGLLQHDVFGVVPSAPELAFQAIEEGIPMVTMQPDSLVAQQFRTIAEHLAQV